MQLRYINSIVKVLTGLVVGLSGGTKAQATTLEFTLTQTPQVTVRATTKPTSPVALTFVPKTGVTDYRSEATNRLGGTVAAAATNHSIGALFEGDSSSLVAKAVGSAEGTRTSSGGYTSAYYGHIDPGNGVWNLGSFSYQHGAASPQEADRKQLYRLQQQARELRRQTRARGFQLSLLEELNGIDLANQAPLAALDRGYINWLDQARSMNLSEPIVWARTKAFLDPDTGTWDAPGLGNHWDTIYRDQQRRYDAIARVLEAVKTTKEPATNHL